MSNSTIGILAERLCRRICQSCKVPDEVDEATLGYFGFTKDNVPTFYKGEGCDKWGRKGLKGRVGIYGVLVMNDELCRLAVSGAKSSEIRDGAVKHGMITLKDYALILLRDGLATFEEVLQAVVASD